MLDSSPRRSSSTSFLMRTPIWTWPVPASLIPSSPEFASAWLQACTSFLRTNDGTYGKQGRFCGLQELKSIVLYFHRSPKIWWLIHNQTHDIVRSAFGGEPSDENARLV